MPLETAQMFTHHLVFSEVKVVLINNTKGMALKTTGVGFWTTIIIEDEIAKIWNDVEGPEEVKILN